MPHTNRKKNYIQDPMRDPLSAQYMMEIEPHAPPSRMMGTPPVVKKGETKTEFLIREGADPKMLKLGVRYPQLEGIYQVQSGTEREIAAINRSRAMKKEVKRGKSVKFVETAPDVTETSPQFIKSWLKKHRQMDDVLKTIKLTVNSTAMVDAGGNIQDVFQSQPGGATNWSDLANVFDSFRVLGMRVTFDPTLIVGGSTSTSYAPIAVVCDYNSSTALVSYAQAAQYANYAEHPGQRRWEFAAGMFGIETAVFQDTASPQAKFYVKLFSTGGTASVTIGRFTVDYVVQFRGTA